MKKNYLTLVVLCFFVYTSNSQTIVSTDPENRKAVVEELTGIHCWACPDGHRILNDAKAAYPGQVFAIKAHSGGFAWDCTTTGGYNFNTQWNNGEYETLMQNAGAYPAASVNRQVFDGFPHYVSGGTALSRSGWFAAVENVLSQPAYVNIAVSASILDSNLEILVEAYYTDNSPATTNYLHVAILQDETNGPQFSASLNPDYVVSYEINPTYGHAAETEELEYRHMDRLVDLVNGFSGEQINNTAAGSFVSRSITYELPEYYNDVAVNTNEIKVVAFITETDQNIINGAGSIATTQQNDILVSNIGLDDPVVPGVSELGLVVTNNGANDASNFSISYQINDGEIITEYFNGTLASGNESYFTFSNQPDFSNYEGEVNITISVEMDGDDDTSNDSISELFSIYSYCAPSMDCSYGDGFQLVQIGDINNTSGCEGYGNFMDQSTDIELGSTNDLTITTGYGDQVIKVWIDFNDDLYFSNDEVVVDNYVVAQGSAAGEYTETIPLVIGDNVQLGEHIMRLKSNWQAAVSEDPCETSQYGETEDYTVNIVESLSVSQIDHSLINIHPNPSSGEFNVRVHGEDLDFEVFNIIGQRISFGKLTVGDNSINLTDFEDGLFILKLRGDGGDTRSYKLIKNSKF